MKKLKNKFILIIIWIIFCIIASQAYIAYSHWKNDTNSYLRLVKWEASLNDALVEMEKKYILRSWDKVHTRDESLAVIEWWDGSLSRLWWNTVITIEQNQVSQDYTDIQISFDLIAGRTWSQVVSFFDEGSSFTQTFNGIEAWVRWTVFDVDLENNFLRSSDHAVTITKEDGSTLRLEEGEILDIQKFSLVELSYFIKNMEDRAWKELNKSLDNEYIKVLKSRLEEEFSTNPLFLFILDFISPKYRIIQSLNNSDDFEKTKKLIEKVKTSKKQSVYNALLSEYQSLNFVSAWDYSFYKKKLNYKRALILLSNNDVSTQRLIETSTFDLKDATKGKITDGIAETLDFINANAESIPNIDSYLEKINFDYLPSGLLLQFQESFSSIPSISSFQNMDINNIGNALWDLDSSMQWFLDDTIWWFIENIPNK